MFQEKKDQFDIGTYYSFKVLGDYNEYIGKVITVSGNDVTFDNTMFLHGVGDGATMLPVLQTVESLGYVISTDKITFKGKTISSIVDAIEKPVQQEPQEPKEPKEPSLIMPPEKKFELIR